MPCGVSPDLLMNLLLARAKALSSMPPGRSIRLNGASGRADELIAR